MADTAFQTQYRDETIAGFEQRQSLLRGTVTTEAVIKGNTAVFLVADSGAATATTRGVNGLIIARADNLTQNSCTLSEWHDLVRKTNFNIFASQGDQRAIMQKTTMTVINRKIDSQIITELNTGTNDSGATKTASYNLVVRGQVVLGNAGVPWDNWITLLCTPAFLGYLKQSKEFASAEYVGTTPIGDGAAPNWRDQPTMYRWDNMAVIVHPNLPGVGTTAEKCFLYHRDAIGHAADTGGMETPVGYNEEQGYSFARASMNMGAKLLQNSGVFVFNHDGSAFVAE
jgi:hypothetical protein